VNGPSIPTCDSCGGYLLLRCPAWRGRWGHSFSRRRTLLRAALWQKRDLHEWLDRPGDSRG